MPDYSPFTDIADENAIGLINKQSAIDRLKMEYGVLRDIWPKRITSYFLHLVTSYFASVLM